MTQYLLSNPLLLLFAVAAIGYTVGKIRIAGSSIGIAAVLFVGIAFGALDPNMKLPDIVYQLGLILFVYTIGLSSGPSFFVALRGKGWRDNLLVVGILGFAALLCVGLYNILKLKPELTVGMFAGSLTNTPALAASLEFIKANNASSALLNQMLADPVIGYSLCYPMGVIGNILAINLTQRLWKIDYKKEAQNLREPGVLGMLLKNQSIQVLQVAATTEPLEILRKTNAWDVLFSRISRNGQISLVNGTTQLAIGDLVSVVGTDKEVQKVVAYLGEISDVTLEQNRSELDFRRIFVSNPRIAGHRLEDLHLPQRYGAIITRVRRGDAEFLPKGETVLELGDRVRVVAPPAEMGTVSAFLGDSFRSLSEVNILTFSLGLVLGLLLGTVPIPVPGGLNLSLGIAGGPLVVALIFGVIEHTGPLVWTIPYNANLTIRQIGLVLFLAGVGTRAGYPFVSTFSQNGGLSIFIGGAIVTCLSTFLLLWLGRKLLKTPMGILTGMLAAFQTQPAVLSYALEQSGDELPNLGYARVYPAAIIAKILLAEILLIVLTR
jgi:putative transport protein